MAYFTSDRRQVASTIFRWPASPSLPELKSLILSATTLLLTTLTFSFTQSIRLGTVRALGHAVDLAPSRCLCSLLAACFRGGATISLPYLSTAHGLSCPLLTSVTRWARLAVHSVLNRTRHGSPGVIPATFDARLSDIPSDAKTTDRGLRCVLPARPTVTKPVSACCSSARIFALGFFQVGVTASPLPSASLRLRRGWLETLV